MIGMEDKFVLELGYELLSLVDRDNHPELLDGILNLRKQKTYIPKIRIMDNITLDPFEISLNKERSILNKEENLTSQILTIIENFVEKHSEIWEEMELVVKPGEMLTFRFLQDDEEYKVKAKVIGIFNDTIDLELEKNLKFQFQILSKDR